MRRLLWLGIVACATTTVFAQEDMSSYSGLLYHVSDYMAADASHAVTLVSFYPDHSRSRTYLFKARE